jgi:hypothetical protein
MVLKEKDFIQLKMTPEELKTLTANLSFKLHFSSH